MKLYTIQVRTGEGVKTITDAQLIPNDQLPEVVRGYRFASHTILDGDGYNVSELSSGFNIGASTSSRKEAESYGIDRLALYADKVADSVAKAIAKHGELNTGELVESPKVKAKLKVKAEPKKRWKRIHAACLHDAAGSDWKERQYGGNGRNLSWEVSGDHIAVKSYSTVIARIWHEHKLVILAADHSMTTRRHGDDVYGAFRHFETVTVSHLYGYNRKMPNTIQQVRQDALKSYYDNCLEMDCLDIEAVTHVPIRNLQYALSQDRTIVTKLNKVLGFEGDTLPGPSSNDRAQTRHDLIKERYERGAETARRNGTASNWGTRSTSRYRSGYRSYEPPKSPIDRIRDFLHTPRLRETMGEVGELAKVKDNKLVTSMGVELPVSLVQRLWDTYVTDNELTTLPDGGLQCGPYTVRLIDLRVPEPRIIVGCHTFKATGIVTLAIALDRPIPQDVLDQLPSDVWEVLKVSVSP